MPALFASFRSSSSLLLGLIVVLGLSGCASQKMGSRSSVVDYLYPQDQQVNIEPATPVLTLPLRVGIAFVPADRSHSSGGNAWALSQHGANLLDETAKQRIMENIAGHFRSLDYISDIQIIPGTYLRPQGSFANLEQLKSMFGFDVIALVSYDQLQFSDETKGALSYWTLVGAYLVSGQKNDTSTLMDTAVEIPLGGGRVWRPTDGGPPSDQPMTLADGLAFSKNTITAQVMQQVGPARVAEVARALGVRQSPLEEVPSLALGTSPVTLKEMVTAYSSIANLGRYVEPVLITRIEDRHGKVLETFAPSAPETVFEPRAAQTLRNTMRGAIAGLVPPVASTGVTRLSTDARNTGVFVQDRLTLGDFGLLLGLRHDRFKDAYSVPVTDVSKTQPSAALSWQPRPGSMVYASHARSFQANSGTLVWGAQSAPPSEGKQLEVGWKQEWLDQRLMTTVSAFDLELTNAPATDPAHPGYSVLTARQRIRGIELELQGRITPGWTVTANASFHDPKVLADTTAGANVGNRVERATRRNASLWTQYRLPQLPGLWVGGGLVHQGDKFTANDNKWRLPGYTVVDLAVGYQFAGGVRLQANLKNAGNRRYYIDGTTTAAGFGAVVPGTPRSLQVSLDYTF